MKTRAFIASTESYGQTFNDCHFCNSNKEAKGLRKKLKKNGAIVGPIQYIDDNVNPELGMTFKDINKNKMAIAAFKRAIAKHN